MSKKKKLSLDTHIALGKSLKGMSDAMASAVLLFDNSYAKKSSVNRLARNIFKDLITLRRELDASLTNDYRGDKVFIPEVDSCYYDSGQLQEDSEDFLRLPRFNAKGMIGLEIPLYSREFRELLATGLTYGFWYISSSGEMFKFVVLPDDRDWYVKNIKTRSTCYAGTSPQVFDMLVKGEEWINTYQWELKYQDDLKTEEETNVNVPN